MNIYFFEVKDDEHQFLVNTNFYPKIFKEPFSSSVTYKCNDADIICGWIHSDFSKQNLEKLPNLKMIVTRSVGYDHIDLVYCDKHNIKVCHVPDYGSHVIAEHVFALLLSSIRNIIEGEEQIKKDHFDEAVLRGISLKGKTLGLIGLGKIGAHVCRIASKGFLMNVVAFDIKPDKNLEREYGFRYVDSVEDIYRESDFISLHVPLFSSTRHMINKKSIAHMKDGVVLINTSRGGIINTIDLIDAIKKNKFSNVALDVVEHEDNIKESQELLELDNVIVTPHIAYYTYESVEEIYRSGVESIQNFIKKRELKNQVHGL